MRTFLKNAKNLKLILQKPFGRDISSKPAINKSQSISKSRDSNLKSSISSKSRKSSNSSKSHKSFKSSKSSNNSRSSEKLLLEKQKGSTLVSQAKGKLERQIWLIEMKKELHIETGKEDTQWIYCSQKYMKRKADRSINRLEKIEFYTHPK